MVSLIETNEKLSKALEVLIEACEHENVWTGTQIGIALEEARTVLWGTPEQGRIDVATLDDKHPKRFAKHYDTIPHGNCDSPLQCDCACTGCLRDWIRAGRPGRRKIENCSHPEWGRESKLCVKCGIPVEEAMFNQ